ncbi:LGFP repeat-containing protein [Tsukamurella tyrosinosolvens]|uniref:LGFP repeat-containing protein n=1 Tax=Tsukamurella tyrosinosolvens TaxID=57704 RepID=UPI0036B61693
MRIARTTLTTFVAVAAAALVAAAPAMADPAAPAVPAVPVAPAGAPAAPAAAAPAAPAAPAAAAPAAAAPAATPAAAGTPLVSTANAVPASAQPALTELAKIPGVQQILATGQLPTTDVATLVKMFGSDPNAQKLLGQLLAGQAAATTPAADTKPDEPLKFAVTGAINDTFTKDGGQKKYGQPLGVEKDVAGGSKVQEFTNGTIYWNPKVNGGKAAGVTGAIRDLYVKQGGPTGKLGFPLMSELSVGGPTAGSVAGAYNDFQNGSIVWSPEYGAHVVSGKIKDQWVKGGGAFGMGYPKSDVKNGAQEFTKGGVLKG